MFRPIAFPLLLLLLLLLRLAASGQSGLTVSGPPGLQLTGILPESPLFPLYEQTPLKNRLDLRINFENGTGSTLTFQEGAVRLRDENGGLLANHIVDVELFSKRVAVGGFQLGQRLVDFTSFNNERMTAMVADGPDRVVAAGWGFDSSGQPVVLLAALMINGTLDTSFSGNGLAAGTIGYANAMARQPDGKLVVAGRNLGNEFFVERFNSSGSQDTAFGVRITAINSFAEALAVAVDSQNRLVLGGYTSTASGHQFAVVRLEPGGNEDASFGSAGVVVTDFITANSEQCRAILIDGSDNIVAVGWGVVGGQLRLAAAKYRASDGGLDTTFSGDGKFLEAFSGATHVAGDSATFMPDGRIVVGGRAVVGSENRLAVAVLGVNGTFDRGFGGGDGQVITDFLTTDHEFIHAVTVDGSGRIVVAGHARDSESGYFGLARYTSAGALDPQFENDGKLKTFFPGTTTADAQAVVVTPSQDIIAGGTVVTEDGEWKFAFARYGENGSPISSPAVDDGDAVSLNLTDFNFFTSLDDEAFDGFDPKNTPARVDVELKFQEFAAPFSITGIQPVVFEQNHLPMLFPAAVPPVGYWYLSVAHEFGTHHEGSQLQRFHYDLHVRELDGNKWLTNCDVTALTQQYSTHPNFDANATYTTNDFAECSLTYNVPIVAVANGIVVFARDGVPNNFPGNERPPDSPGGGNTVIIEHGNGVFSWYAHMAPGSLMVSTNPPNNTVVPGQIIGRAGHTGNSSGPHLHFGLLENFDGSTVGNSQGLPAYFINAFFQTGGQGSSMRQLRSAPISGTYIIQIDPGPIPWDSPGRAFGPGPVVELSDHDSLENPQRLALPVAVLGQIEVIPGRILADGGDAIEDVYRFTVTDSGVLSAQLRFPAGADLDLLLYNQNLFAIQPGDAKTLANPETLCASLAPGTYYLLVSLYDPSGTSPVTYQLDAAFNQGGRDLHVDKLSTCNLPAGNLACNAEYGGPYQTVSDGLAVACPGDRMFIRVGTYPEAVVFRKPLQIRSYVGTAVINP